MGRPIAFLCAMPMELRPLTRRLGLVPAYVGGLRLEAGTLGERQVLAVVSGMGTDLAARATTRLLDAVRPDRVVVVGITGAVDDDVPIGTVVLPEVVVDAATGREHRHHLLGPGSTSGVMWTTDAITRAEELPALRRRGVRSLDMETAAVAAVCEQRDVPWSVFRAISDRATDGTVDDELFHLSHQDGTPNPRAIIRYLLRHPGRVPRLARMGRNAKLATERAAAAAVAAVGGA